MGSVRLIHHVQPEYPLELRHPGYQEVRSRCMVLKDLTVAGITHGGGAAALFPSAKAAVERWRYEPPRLSSPYTGRAESIGNINIVLVSFNAPTAP